MTLRVMWEIVSEDFKAAQATERRARKEEGGKIVRS